MTVGSHVVLAAADAAAGTTLATCGVLTRRRRPASRVGWLMLAASGCWYAGNLTHAAAYLHRGPLVHLHLSYPTGKLHRTLPLLTVALAYVAAAVDTLARDPWITGVVALCVALTAVDVFTRSAGPGRKAAMPALVAALGFAAALALGAANQLLAWHKDLAVALIYDVVVPVLVVLLTTDLLRRRWTDATLADLVTGLGAGADTPGVRRLLRRAVGDPALEIGYWVAGRGRYVDDAGQPLDLGATPAGSTVTRIDDDDGPLAVLIHDAAALDDPELVEGAVAAVRLAMDNARMDAAVRERVIELNASRRRIVEATDTQRLQLERELAHGAQARLDEAADVLETCRPAALSAELDDLLAELEGARAELRRFARGIRPRELSAGGLAEALPVLASRSPVPVTLHVDSGRYAAAIESGLYFVCSEALANAAKHGHATRIDLILGRAAGIVEATIRDDGVGGADPRGHGLRGLADRVHALDGTISIGPGPCGGTEIRARLPTSSVAAEGSP
jgi:signal transduction histidine kinase